MRRGWVERAALAAAVVGVLSAGTANAQTAAPDAGTANDSTAAPVKAKPKAAASKVKKLPSIEVVVVNHRSVGLVQLTAASGGADPVRIAGPLAAGKKTIAHLAHDKACLFDLHGEFADEAETETGSYDLCKNKTIDLVD